MSENSELSGSRKNLFRLNLIYCNTSAFCLCKRSFARRERKAAYRMEIDINRRKLQENLEKQEQLFAAPPRIKPPPGEAENRAAHQVEFDVPRLFHLFLFYQFCLEMLNNFSRVLKKIWLAAAQLAALEKSLLLRKFCPVSRSQTRLSLEERRKGRK